MYADIENVRQFMAQIARAIVPARITACQAVAITYWGMMRANWRRNLEQPLVLSNQTACHGLLQCNTKDIYDLAATFTAVCAARGNRGTLLKPAIRKDIRDGSYCSLELPLFGEDIGILKAEACP
jgi:hypothetical protein